MPHTKIRKRHEKDLEGKHRGKESLGATAIAPSSNTNTSVQDEYLRALPVSQELIAFLSYENRSASIEAINPP